MVTRRAFVHVLILVGLSCFPATRTSHAQTPHVFAESSVQPDRVIVGEPVQLRLSVFTSTWFTKGISHNDPEVPLGFARGIGRSISYTEQRDGQSYAVSSRRYLVWTNQAGTITIPALRITTESPQPGQSTGVPVEISSPPVDLTVLPPPDGFDAERWMTARRLSIDHSWSRRGDGLKTGDAVRLTIDMRAEGTVAALLKPTPMPDMPGVTIHAEPPVLSDRMGSETNSATRSETWTFVLTEPGTFEVPEIRIPWWNYDTDSRREVVIPSNTLSVAENPDLDPDLVSPPDTSGAVETVRQRHFWWPPPWPAVFLLVVIVVGSLAAIRSRRRHEAMAPKPSVSYKLPELNPRGNGQPLAHPADRQKDPPD